MNSYKTPHHVAIIMDGNRRWAAQHGLGLLGGHQEVAETLIERLAQRAIDREVSFLTMWAFSTENWRRDPVEVAGLMELFRHLLNKKISVLHDKGIRVCVIGDITRFPKDIQEKIHEGMEKTKKNTKLTLTFALNYGGRDELKRAVQKLVQEVAAGKIAPADISETTIANFLDTTQAELPDPDLIIRPGGEQRLSGFLPWQTVYAELYFSSLLMPDFGPEEFDKALQEYGKRQRNFGK